MAFALTSDSRLVPALFEFLPSLPSVMDYNLKVIR